MTHPPLRNHSFPHRLLAELRVRHLANILIAASIFIVLGTTLYPFDFTTEDVDKRWAPFVAPKIENLRSLQDDAVTNIVLFLPIGVGFGIIAVRKRMSMLGGLGAVTLAGALLSLFVEVLQLFLPFRYSSLLDIAANTIGSAVGYMVYIVSARPLYQMLTRAVERGREGNASGWLVAAYCIYLLCVCLITVPLQHSSLIYEFNKFTYPLVVGNEPTGDKGWNGRMYDLIITRHGLAPEGVARYLLGKPLAGDDARMIVARYVLKGHAPYSDLARLNAPLEWRGGSPDAADTMGASITEKRWLQTANPAYELSSSMIETKRFTICFSAQSLSWSDKARIVTVSSSPYQRNFSVLQLGNDLAVRYRSMTTGINGTNPQFIVPDVFADSLLHRIVVSLDATQLHVYIDRIENHYDVELGPGFALLNRTFPTRGVLDLSSAMKNFHNYLYAALAFMPLAYMLGLLLTQEHASLVARLLITTIGVLFPPFLVEEELVLMTGRSVIHEHIHTGIAIMIATTVITWSYYKLKPGFFPDEGRVAS
ncbi:MAG: hypothetical protein C4326_14380 [Ignavibacteria bacterium]